MTENELLDANFALTKKVMVLEEENEWLRKQLTAVQNLIGVILAAVEAFLEREERTGSLQ